MNVAVIPLNMTLKLPTERDFDPHGCGLDEQCAWRNFGGLSLEEAYQKFASAPEVYQEDFMFMGTGAFVYYYPVVEQFLRYAVTVLDDERGDCQSWILPQCIRMQFFGTDRQLVGQLKNSVISLCEFMLENIECFADDWSPPTEIEEQWRSLRDHVERY